MADPYLTQIILFGGNFAPRTYAFCDGQLMPINQYQALFSLMGTAFGGDGRTTFALPDARGRAVLHPGRGPGLPDYQIGQRGGVETVALTTDQIPSHTHTATNSLSVSLPGNANPGTASNPAGAVLAEASIEIRGGGQATANIYAAADTADASMAPAVVSGSVGVANAGGSQGHNNMQPYTVVNYCIALQGLYPSRS